MATLILMGISTLLIGLPPGHEDVGVTALVALRSLPGVSAGGEWGGAGRMAVESAPQERRGWLGAFPQIGAPIGLILATQVLLILNTTLGEAAMTQ